MFLSLRGSRVLTASLSTLLLTSSPVVGHLLAPTPASAAPTPACVAGTDYVETTDGADTVLVFSNTNGCDWTVPTGVTSLDLLLVGGGGGGGARVGGGGGGGAVETQPSVNLAFPTYTITVGRGGDGARFDVSADNTFHQGSDGGDSVFEGGGAVLHSAEGGGVGGSWDGTAHSQLPGNGGSGGGSGATTSAGVGNPGGDGGVADTDNSPHPAGGGGGAGSPGLGGSTNFGGGAGGGGIFVDIVVRGTPVGYGGGGGGGMHGTWGGGTLNDSPRAGGGGPGGGGNGGAPSTSASTVYGQDGTDGLGGGGGGAANSGDSQGSIGGDGGRGVVVLRWPTVVPAVTPIWRVTLDPNGGTCVDSTEQAERWTSVFVGYRYLPNDSDCTRPGYTFTGWASTNTPSTPTSLPVLVDPRDNQRRAFLAANADLIAMWTPDPTPITDVTVFANFMCGPCTTVWLIHSPTDDDVTVDITVNNQPTTCSTSMAALGLTFCELTPLSPGDHTITLTPRHDNITGPPTRIPITLKQ